MTGTINNPNSYRPSSPINLPNLIVLAFNHSHPHLANRVIRGFWHGFDLGYKGLRWARECLNMPSAIAKPDILRAKFQKELLKGCFIRPFSKPLFKMQRHNALALVPKKGAKTDDPNDLSNFHLITNLSFLTKDAINNFIHREKSTVHYQPFDTALHLINTYGLGSFLAKSDIDSAFRLIPMNLRSIQLLRLKLDGEYYIDTMLPFGASSSCQLFELFATFMGISIMQHTGCQISHYLDDFFFCAPMFEGCLQLLTAFQTLCRFINCPLSADKTEGPAQSLTYLGLGLDTVQMTIYIPQDKIDKTLTKLKDCINRKKATV